MNHSKEQIRNNYNGNLERIFLKFFYNWVFSSEMSASEIMDSYFTSDFVAQIDGIQLGRDDFLRRIDRMRRDAIVEQQEFIEMMEEGNRLFSMHTTKGVSNASGKNFETRAIALFAFSGDKISQAYLNSVTIGDPKDLDFASRS